MTSVHQLYEDEKIEKKIFRVETGVARIEGQTKKRSGLEPEKQPHQYLVLNGLLEDYNTNLGVISDPFETSNVKEHLENEEGSADDSDEEIQTETDNAREAGYEKKRKSCKTTPKKGCQIPGSSTHLVACKYGSAG